MNMNMKTNKFNSAVGVFLLGISICASAVEYKPHAICDKKSGVCADSEGISVALTKRYLGDKAETKLMAEINKVGMQDFDPTWFTMSGGLTCKTKEKMCWTTRLQEKVDRKAMKTLFGN